MEFHLTDHCNLNCKGCGHFSSLAPPHFADIQQYERDIKRLSKLFRNIHTIRLMGGEPLLHPDPAAFITATRKHFPKSDVRLVTNGLLLPKASAEFWNACRKANVAIDVTVYPPLKSRLPALQLLCSSEKVPLRTIETGMFHAGLNLRGDSDQDEAFNVCHKSYNCPFLCNGHLHICVVPALAHYFNDRFGCRIPEHPGIDLHSPSVSGRRVQAFLSRSLPTCKFCACNYAHFHWSTSNYVQQEWDAESMKREAAGGNSHLTPMTRNAAATRVS
jgi:hypothetical protein